jgi:guanylate kinase
MADSQTHGVIDLTRLPGILVVISGPAGSGKNTLVNALLAAEGDRMWESVSCTTREMRPGEADGEHYHKLTRDEFERRAKEAYFLEYAEFGGNLYGTPAAAVVEHLERGVDVLIIAEVQGAAQISQRVSDALTVFVMPQGDTPAEWEQHLRQRLARRGTESSEQIERRVQAALTRELPRAADYHYQVVNRDGEQEATVRQLHAIIEAARSSHARHLEILQP